MTAPTETRVPLAGVSASLAQGLVEPEVGCEPPKKSRVFDVTVPRAFMKRDGMPPVLRRLMLVED
jgi:hypothetical protein